MFSRGVDIGGSFSMGSFTDTRLRMHPQVVNETGLASFRSGTTSRMGLGHLGGERPKSKSSSDSYAIVGLIEGNKLRTGAYRLCDLIEHGMSNQSVYEQNAQRCEGRAAVAESDNERYCWDQLAEAWLKLATRPSSSTKSLGWSIRRLIAAASSI